MIRQGHGIGNVLQFCLYLDLPSRPAIKSVLSSDLESVGQGHYLLKSPYLSYSATDFYQIFLEIITSWPV